MPEKLISDAARGSLVTRKRRVTVLAPVIRVHQYASLIEKYE
jgi:hypothetical protein